MSTSDIRWQQRFSNFQKAKASLRSAVALSKERELSVLEKQGLIQGFEFTYELAWNVLRDYLRFQGNNQIIGSRDAIRESFQAGLVDDGHGWMDMLKDRTLTVHTYNEETAEKIAEAILNSYFDLFERLEEKMKNFL